MDATAGMAREVVVPASIFGTLRAELAREVGDLPAIHALNAAGYASGVEASEAFRKHAGGDPGSLGQARFWERMTSFFTQRGWGTLRHRDDHEAVGVLSSSDWSESGHDGADGSCSFSSGVLSGFLTELAGGPVGVLEVECRGRGGARCTFAFGSETAIHELYGSLVAGSDLDQALGAL